MIKNKEPGEILFSVDIPQSEIQKIRKISEEYFHELYEKGWDCEDGNADILPLNKDFDDVQNIFKDCAKRARVNIEKIYLVFTNGIEYHRDENGCEIFMVLYNNINMFFQQKKYKKNYHKPGDVFWFDSSKLHRVKESQRRKKEVTHCVYAGVAAKIISY